ncbi:ferritin-like superfamily [Mycena floridula]|nr:ferritin-like superfamily [Mycena floridula]
MTSRNKLTSMKNSIQESISEPILTATLDRFVVFPIKYPEVIVAVACFWTPEEIDLSHDIDHWNNRLTDDECHLIEHILAFFASADGISRSPEIRCFYGFQVMMENIHAETYSLLLDTYVRDPLRKSILFNGLRTLPCVAAKTNWALKWIADDSLSFGARLVAAVAVEGIFFSASFAALFWLKKRLHTTFASHLFSLLHQRPSASLVKCILREAVTVEESFWTGAFNASVIGLNQESMCEYIRFVADRLAVDLSLEPLYNAHNPFDFMK